MSSPSIISSFAQKKLDQSRRGLVSAIEDLGGLGTHLREAQEAFERGTTPAGIADLEAALDMLQALEVHASQQAAEIAKVVELYRADRKEEA